MLFLLEVDGNSQRSIIHNQATSQDLGVLNFNQDACIIPTPSSILDLCQKRWVTSKKQHFPHPTGQMRCT